MTFVYILFVCIVTYFDKKKTKTKKITHWYSTSSSSGRLKILFCATCEHQSIQNGDHDAARAPLVILILVLPLLQLIYKIILIWACVRLVPVKKNIFFLTTSQRYLQKNYWPNWRLRVTTVRKMKLIAFKMVACIFCIFK